MERALDILGGRHEWLGFMTPACRKAIRKPPDRPNGRIRGKPAERAWRRDAADLALIRADQLERDTSVVNFTARLLAGLVRTENVTALRQALPDALPWSTFLPPEDVDMLLADLVDTAQGAAALENLTPIALLLTQWRHSAEIYADPTLLAILTREPDGDLGSVPPPLKPSDRPVTPKRGDRAAPPPIERGPANAALPAGAGRRPPHRQDPRHQPRPITYAIKP